MQDDPDIPRLRLGVLGARLALHSVGRRAPVLCEGGVYDATRPELRLDLRARDGRGFTLVVAPFDAGRGCYKRVGDLALSHRDGEHTRLVESYFTFLTRSLVDVTFAELAEWIRTRFPAAPAPDTLQERVAHVREGQPYSSGAPSHWAEFHSTAHRGLGESVRLLHRVVGVQHQDPECLVFPELFARPLKFIKYPWTSRTRWPFQAYVPPDAPVREDLRRPQNRTITSRMGEREVILGGNASVQGALAQVARDDWHEIATLAFTCTPQIIGDDLGAAVRAYRAESPRPLLHVQDDQEHPARPLIALLREAIARGEPATTRAGRFNLLGFLPEQLALELEVLEDLGLELGVSVLPDIHLGDCESYLRAEVQVINPQRYLARFVDELFAALPLPVVAAPAPLGWRASEAWCQEVARTLGRGEESAQAWSLRAEARRGTWDAARERVRGHRLGFVLSAGSLAAHLSGAAFEGLPLLPALREMGFAFDFLLKEGVADTGADEGDRVLRFSSPAELRVALRDSPAAAFYSEYNYDWRLSTTGKASFSFHDLGLGALGALRNARYLAGLCEATFHARLGSLPEAEERWARLEARHG